MSFFVSQKTLERLEWPQVLEMLQKHARTPGGREKFAWSNARELFESTRYGVEERLEETTEARAILGTGTMPPLADVAAPTVALARARKDAVLSARELLDLAATCASARITRNFLVNRLDTAPRLADLASLLVEHRDLEAEIDTSIERSGELKDSASRALATARAQSRNLAAEIQSKISRFLSDSHVAPHLSDDYYTVRNDRFVLPVRTEARGSIRGIVHDASNTGQTLFVEPEALVELNNRHKRAEIDIEQETLKILRNLSRQAAVIADDVEANVATMELIDAAFARAGFAEELDAVCPSVGDEGIINTPQLAHPLLAPDGIPSDVRLGDDFQILIVSGPNAGGKTVALKAVAIAALFVRAGLHIAAKGTCRVDLFDAVFSDIGDEQAIRDSLSTFSAHMANLSEISNRVSPRSLVVVDEIGVGTDPGEGAALAQAIVESLADAGARVVATTHYNLLKELAEVDDRFANASVEFDSDTLEPTYVLKMGLPGISSATAVTARMGISSSVIDRANELLDREDRQLDRVLSELATSRAALDLEQREIAQIRIETEAVRAEHQAKLQRLQDRRDKLFQSMRQELEHAFRGAHEQVAGVIRDLQRKGTAQGAAESRLQLQVIEQTNRQIQQEASLEETPQSKRPIHWAAAAAGDPVEIDGSGRGTLVSLPDRRGRVEVRLGSARVSVPMQRVGASTGEPPSMKGRPPRGKVSVTSAGTRGGSLRPTEIDAGRCDLHGLRVDEAIDRLIEALDLALSSDRMSLTINHGVGSGALRRAVRDYLRRSPYIARYTAADSRSGGEGVTIAEFV
jgi:DNA mismatch repair protein MutS2